MLPPPHNGLDRWEDVCRAADRLTRHDRPVTWDDEFPGMRRLYAEDDHGNRLEFLRPRG